MRVLRLAEVQAKTGLARSTLYKYVDRPERPVSPSCATTRGTPQSTVESVPVSPEILKVASEAYSGSDPVGILVSHNSDEGDPVGAVRMLVPNAKEPVLDTGVPGAVDFLRNTLVVYTDVPATPSDSID